MFASLPQDAENDTCMQDSRHQTRPRHLPLGKMTPEDDPMQQIAERLKQLRENADLKQKDVAKAIGVGLDAYKSYETGRRSVPADVLREAARFYGYSRITCPV